MDKARLRKKLIQKRLDLDSETYALKSNLIISKLKRHPQFIQAKSIGIYVSFRHEVETVNLINEIINDKIICVPKTNGKLMVFHQILSINELKESKLGILEPDNDRLVNKTDLDLLIIPIVGYDQNGNRLGYGGGYYDRYLSDYQGNVIGLAFSFQEVTHLPVEAFDIPLEMIINEK